MAENRKMASGAPPGSRPLVAVALAQSLKAQLRVGSPDLPGPGRSLTRLRRRKSYAGTRNQTTHDQQIVELQFSTAVLALWSLVPALKLQTDAGSGILTLGVNDDRRGKGRAAFVAKVRTQVRSTL